MGKQVRLYQAFETARVLLLSGRVPPVETWKCGGWEFEQSILSLEDAERFAPHQSAMGRFLQRPVRGIARYAPQVRHFQFGPGKPPLQKKYELAFATVGSLGDLLALGPPRAWRHKCDIAICNIDDFFLPYLSILKDQIRILEDFDIIYCCCAGSVQALSDRLNKPVMYLPPAVDTLRFLPTRPFDQRAVDVTSIGRRSREEHDALLQYADRTGSFYYYDSISAPKLWSNEPGEHRALLARIIGNSRFFITNHANFDRPDKSAGQEEIGFRFFEGAAAGAVLVGAPPRTTEFQTLFDWEDSVIPVPPDSPDISGVLEDLTSQPERLESISRRNVMQSLRRHDWAHRWQMILDSAGMAPTERLTSHLSKLRVTSDGYAEYHERGISGGLRS